jgi:hypothetical protein
MKKYSIHQRFNVSPFFSFECSSIHFVSKRPIIKYLNFCWLYVLCWIMKFCCCIEMECRQWVNEWEWLCSDKTTHKHRYKFKFGLFYIRHISTSITKHLSQWICKEESFILAHSFGGFRTWSVVSVAFGSVVKQYIMVVVCDKGSYLPHGCLKEKESEIGRRQDLNISFLYTLSYD